MRTPPYMVAVGGPCPFGESRCALVRKRIVTGLSRSRQYAGLSRTKTTRSALNDAQNVREVISPQRRSGVCGRYLPARIVHDRSEVGAIARHDEPRRRELADLP